MQCRSILPGAEVDMLTVVTITLVIQLLTKTNVNDEYLPNNRIYTVFSLRFTAVIFAVNHIFENAYTH
ncbi:MAG: hypothetical protein QE487_18750 [Fluviicola sp.]|nr:hypothetical protein [Fluviicola sp.]